MLAGDPVRIAVPRAEGQRVIAEVDGAAVWFESADEVLLQPLPEVWASSFLVAAAALGRPLEVAGPVGRPWSRNAPQVLALTGQWWGWDAGPPVLAGGTRPPPAGAAARPRWACASPVGPTRSTPSYGATRRLTCW